MKQIPLAMCAILFGISGFSQTQQTNLIAHWSFDEGKGTNVVDGSGNGWNGILEGWPLPGWTKGIAGAAVSFDGVQNQMTVLSPQSAVLSQSNGVFSPQSAVLNQSNGVFSPQSTVRSLTNSNSGLGTLDYGQGLTVAVGVSGQSSVIRNQQQKLTTEGLNTENLGQFSVLSNQLSVTA
jgi:hypothetical protein